MARITLFTDLKPKTVLDLAGDVAHDLGFKVEQLDDWLLGARKGSMGMSFLIGAFEAYCDFKLFVETCEDATTCLTLERNTPWWTGLLGVSRVKTQATKLADAFEEEIEAQGGAILGRSQM